MTKVFVLDSSENLAYCTMLVKHFGFENVDHHRNIDKAINSFGKTTYDLIFISDASGRSNEFDLLDKMMVSKNNMHADFVLAVSGKNKRTRLKMSLRGRRVYSFDPNYPKDLDNFFKTVSEQ